jgi:nucleoside 2-deoxyribosyltransferase
MLRLAQALEAAGFETFLPQRDGLERFIIGRINSRLNTAGTRALVHRAVFALDVFEIVERCAALVINLNGRVPDEGACVEAGIAFAAGKPVVLYKDDERSAFNGSDNSMLLGLGDAAPLAAPDAVAAEVKRRLARAARSAAPPPAPLAQVVARGKTIASLVAKLPKGKATERRILDLLERLPDPNAPN